MGAVRISVLFLAMSCLGVASGQEPAPTPEVSEDIAHDDPRLPVRMRLILAQTEGVGVRVLADTTRVAADALGPRSELLSVGYTYAKTGVITSDYHSQRILTGSISILRRLTPLQNRFLYALQFLLSLLLALLSSRVLSCR